MERRGNLSGFSHSGTQNDNKDVKVNRNANTDVRFDRKHVDLHRNLSQKQYMFVPEIDPAAAV